jgi:hypothetical protein
VNTPSESAGGGGPPKRRTGGSPAPSSWSFSRAWGKAQRHLAKYGPEAASTVTSARELAERLALADMQLCAALRHGTSLRELEEYRSAARLAADLAHRSLAIAGLKSGEGLSLEPSDKLVALLERLQAGEPAGAFDADGEVPALGPGDVASPAREPAP